MKIKNQAISLIILSLLGGSPAMATENSLRNNQTDRNVSKSPYVNPMKFWVHEVGNGEDYMISYGKVLSDMVNAPVSIFLPPVSGDKLVRCLDGQWGYKTNDPTSFSTDIPKIVSGYNCIDVKEINRVRGGEIAAFVAERVNDEEGIMVINVFDDGKALMALDPKYSQDRKYHEGLIEKLRTPNI